MITQEEVKKDYCTKIMEQINQCDDIALLDLIWKLLIKSADQGK